MSNNNSTHSPQPQHSITSLVLGTFGCAPFPALIFSAYCNLENWAEKVTEGSFAN